MPEGLVAQAEAAIAKLKEIIAELGETEEEPRTTQ